MLPGTLPHQQYPKTIHNVQFLSGQFTRDQPEGHFSTQPFFSPVAYLTLCDDRTVEAFRKTNRTQRLIEQQLILLKNHNPSVSIDYLSVFNHLAADRAEGFLVPFVYSEKELKIAEYRLHAKK